MDKFSLILMSLLAVAMVVVIAPGILAMNQGKILRNIALWLAVVLALTLVYRNFGPHEASPTAPASSETSESDGDGTPQTTSIPDTNQGYTPPKE